MRVRFPPRPRGAGNPPSNNLEQVLEHFPDFVVTDASESVTIADMPQLAEAFLVTNAHGLELLTGSTYMDGWEDCFELQEWGVASVDNSFSELFSSSDQLHLFLERFVSMTDYPEATTL